MAKERTYTNEADVKAQVKKLLNLHNWFWWMPPANGFGRSGISDFNALRDGVFLAVETKFGKNKPTAMQIGFLNSVQSESALAFIVNERNLGVFATWLQHFDNAVKAQSEERNVDPADGAAMLDAMKVLTEGM